MRNKHRLNVAFEFQNACRHISHVFIVQISPSNSDLAESVRMPNVCFDYLLAQRTLHPEDSSPHPHPWSTTFIIYYIHNIPMRPFCEGLSHDATTRMTYEYYLSAMPDDANEANGRWKCNLTSAQHSSVDIHTHLLFKASHTKRSSSTVAQHSVGLDALPTADARREPWQPNITSSVWFLLYYNHKSGRVVVLDLAFDIAHNASTHSLKH